MTNNGMILSMILGNLTIGKTKAVIIEESECRRLLSNAGEPLPELPTPGPDGLIDGDAAMRASIARGIITERRAPGMVPIPTRRARRRPSGNHQPHRKRQASRRGQDPQEDR